MIQCVVRIIIYYYYYHGYYYCGLSKSIDWLVIWIVRPLSILRANLNHHDYFFSWGFFVDFVFWYSEFFPRCPCCAACLLASFVLMRLSRHSTFLAVHLCHVCRGQRDTINLPILPLLPQQRLHSRYLFIMKKKNEMKAIRYTKFYQTTGTCKHINLVTYLASYQW